MAQLVVTLKERELNRVVIERVWTAIGRARSCELQIDNPGVSTVHAMVRFREGAFHVEDVESKNGMAVNGTKMHEHRLSDGDQIQIGKFVVTFLNEGGPSPDRLVDNRNLPNVAPALAVGEATTALSGSEMQRIRASFKPAPKPPSSAISPSPLDANPEIERLALRVRLLTVALIFAVTLIAWLLIRPR